MRRSSITWAARHSGKSNVLLDGGHVRAFMIDQVKDGTWTPTTSDAGLQQPRGAS